MNLPHAFHVCILSELCFLKFQRIYVLDKFIVCIVLATLFIYCNPGEVTCRISENPLTIIIWRGQVEMDRYYNPNPIGAARYFDGNTNNIQNTVLSAYGPRGPLGKLI